MAGPVVDDFSSPSQTPSLTIFISLLVPALVLWYVYWRLSRRRLYELAEKLPGPKGLPLIGNALDLTGTSHSECRKKFHLTGSVNFQVRLMIKENLSQRRYHTRMILQFSNSTQLRLLKFFTSRAPLLFAHKILSFNFYYQDARASFLYVIMCPCEPCEYKCA